MFFLVGIEPINGVDVHWICLIKVGERHHNWSTLKKDKKMISWWSEISLKKKGGGEKREIRYWNYRQKCLQESKSVRWVNLEPSVSQIAQNIVRLRLYFQHF